MICCTYVLTITVGSIAFFGVPMALNYSLVNWSLFGFSWTTIWIIWCYNACLGAYYFPGYFFIVCYYLKQRLNSIKIRLNIIRNESKSLTINEKKSMIGRLLEEHNEICEQISDYNKYWRKYITITYSIFLGLICILTYVVFISSGLKWFILVEYEIAFTAHILLIFIITHSASSVSHFNHILYRNLCSLYAENYFSVGFNIKVRFKKHKNKDWIQNLRNFLTVYNFCTTHSI